MKPTRRYAAELRNARMTYRPVGLSKATVRAPECSLSCQSYSAIIAAMQSPAFQKNTASLCKPEQQSSTQTAAMQRLIARQKKLLLSLAGIDSSGFSDVRQRMTRI